MAVAINFDYQMSLGAIEIGDEWSDGMLAAKFETCQTAVTQDLPEFCFGRS